ncbi:uncharacterized protein F4822DRAFT_187079 [Hypoxylon trugodes]|uniref:uncharacterized protein n=1 Tax=Hypoxylon trugodes TaxID=326681 RepID=UPI00219EC982|nr:uncharacterized protein F4822DRAFT_187079 [Hypoxylon trugodes]KAI1391485.1 hypothetical protein F4822DRAFT_187079 [Hypoxylon trugodes]
MTTWISTHGIGAIKDSASSFNIVIEKGYALVKPTTANQLSGWVHYTIPSPPVDYPNLKKASVDFTAQAATVEKVEVYFANSRKFQEAGLSHSSTFTLDVQANQGPVVYGGKGISVSIFVQFGGMGSTIKLQSVAIQV